MKRIAVAVMALASVAVLAGCSNSNQTLRNDVDKASDQLARYQANQPVPQYDWSQYRQTLIDIQGAQVHGIATTSFFYNQGSNVPIKWCPSIGFAVPTTSQLTNPEQKIQHHDAVLPLMEQSGVYTGDSTGTYAICVADDGTKYASYWEGFIYTEGGPAEWNPETQMIELTGDPTVPTTGKE